ncbi:CG30 [Spodoptera exempta nucleopolyhedrovirus]|uniref:CG30 n=1 Tax=Spodoptera exempta nucleopolyhedrovirus TaxID=1242863 RepID=A0A410S7Q5_9ABAC|nr:CG30 [Spodoptera exempta nucleopolyhedrovirus]QAT90362.1 CG30 [Spodoptera exempta nucleopolyhedrovirus]
MSSVTLNCGVCFADVKIRDDFLQHNDLYVGPFLLLDSCNHAFCVSCVKALQNGRLCSINCPMCRKFCKKFRILFFTLNGVFAVEFNSNSIKKFSINSCRLNFCKLVSGMYPFSVAETEEPKPSTSKEPQPSTSKDLASTPSLLNNLNTKFDVAIKDFSQLLDSYKSQIEQCKIQQQQHNDDDIMIINDSDAEEDDNDDLEMKKIMQLSRLQHEIDTLKSCQINLLDLSMQMKTNVESVVAELTNKKLELGSIKNQIESCNNKLKQSVEEFGRQQKLIQEHQNRLSFIESDILRKQAKLESVEEKLTTAKNEVKEFEDKYFIEEKKYSKLRTENLHLMIDNFSLKLKKDSLDLEIDSLEKSLEKKRKISEKKNDVDGVNEEVVSKKIKL